MALVVKRNGQVIDGPTILGTIESRPRQSIGSALMGYEPTQREYRGVRPDGVATPWRDTRKRALQLLARLCEPAHASVTVEASYWGGGKYFSGSVSWDGHSASVSSYAHEVSEDGARLWVIDALFPAGAICPTFSNGSGSRVTVAHVLLPDQARLMDDALKTAGLTVADLND